MTLLSAPSFAPLAGPAGNVEDVASWVEVGAAGVQSVQPAPAGEHAYAGLGSVPPGVPGGQPVSVTVLLTVLVAVVFVVRLGLVLSRKIVPTPEAADPQQLADGDKVAIPAAVAVGAGRNG